jgi:hypothetical protein
MIKKAEGGCKVLSEKGKNLGGPYKTKKKPKKDCSKWNILSTRKANPFCV